MTCPNCGKTLDPSSRFCSGCGRAMYMPPVARSRYIRPRQGRMIAGVCAGIALYHGWDVAIVRLLVALLVLCGCGSPILLYLIAWIVMPNGEYALPPTTGATVS